MHYEDVQKLFAACGVQIRVYHNETGVWKGYHYSWEAFNEGWEVCKVTQVSETFDEALAKMVKVASTLIVKNAELLHSIRETGYKVNKFVYSHLTT